MNRKIRNPRLRFLTEPEAPAGTAPETPPAPEAGASTETPPAAPSTETPPEAPAAEQPAVEPVKEPTKEPVTPEETDDEVEDETEPADLEAAKAAASKARREAKNLRERTKAAEGEARTAKVELAVHRAASAANADPSALLDSRSFAKAVEALDPSKDDFAAKVTEAITKAVEANPRLGATSTTPTPVTNAPGSGGTSDASVSKEAFQKMSPSERNELFVRDPATYRSLTGR